jgi:putrescine aminotransferase
VVSSTNRVTFRVAATAADRADVLRLRDEVYVRDQERLADPSDTADTFDRYDGRAVYILADDGTGPVGTVKVIPDSEAGLPCEDVVDLGSLRPGNRLVEFGHLMTTPRARGQSIGMALMRAALVHSLSAYGATHVIGDFFAEEDGGLRRFYLDLGFVALCEPYQDVRFLHAPLSVVAALDLREAGRRTAADTGRSDAVLQYFFHDYHDHLRDSR